MEAPDVASPVLAKDACQSIKVTLLTMGGCENELPAIPVDHSVGDLALAVRDRLDVPIAAQKLLWNGELLTDPTLKLVDVFGSSEAVHLMVVKRALTQEENAELFSHLVRAVASGDAAEVQELLKEGARVEHLPVPPEGLGEEPQNKSKGEDGDSGSDASSGSAPMAGDGSCTQNSSKCPCGGLTPMMMAMATHDENLAKVLRDRGAAEPDMKPTTASLVEAFKQKDFVEVTRHLAAGADVNTRLKRGEGIRASSSGHPLHACCAMRQPGAYEVTQLLLAKKADTTLGDAEGDTPLAHAKYFNAGDIYRLLESNGAVVAGPYFRMFGTM